VGLSTEPSTRGPAFFRTVASLGVQAALALDHAHQLGVVHRDVKPANLLVDGRGHLWVTDFGLARCHGQAGLTVSGDLVGTLRYMSPEQALARHGLVDHRSDVYSLGVTLYELLTLEPACPGGDRQEVLRRLERQEPRPPRQLNQAVPKDLETVVLKALAKEPADRYGTAQELADDLRRFLEDRPVRARRPTVAQRLARWSRRHRPVVGVAALLLLLAAAGLAVSNVLVRREQARAEAQRRQVEANFQKARDAVDQMLAEVGHKWLANVPQMEPVRRKLLERALAFYEGFLEERGTDPALRWEAGRAYRRVGDIRDLLGEYERAEQAYAAALEVLGGLVAERPADPDYRQELARSHNGLGVLLQDTGRDRAAEGAWLRALALQEQLAAEHPAVADYRQELARSHNNLGILLHKAGRAREAEEAYRQALALREQVAAEHPGQPDYRHEVAASHTNLGNLLQETGRPQAAEEAYRHALALGEKLAAQRPGVLAFREFLATSHNNLAALLQDTGRPRAAEEAFRRALALGEKLADEFPAVPAYRHDLARSHNNLGILLHQAGRVPEAEEAWSRAQALGEKLADEHPAAPDFRQELARSHHGLGILLRSTGRVRAAEEAFRRALALKEKLADEHPAVPAYRRDLGADYTCLGNLLQDTGRAREAEGPFRRALALRAALAAEHPAVPLYRQDLARSHTNLGVLLQQTGRLREAIGAYRRAVKGDPDSPAVQNQLAWLLATCPTTELRDAPQAVELAKQAVARAPTNAAFWTTLGVAQYRAGDWPAAVASLEKSMQLGRGGDAADWFFLAMAHWQSGAKDKARPWYDRAVGWTEKNGPKDEELGRLRAEAAALLGLSRPPAATGKEVPPDQ
jgi:tetratricopeptide (TPR) repeat protein